MAPPDRGPSAIVDGGRNAAVDLLAGALSTTPDKIAFIDEGGAYSFSQVARRVALCGAALLDLGLAPGDRVILCLLDGIDFVSGFLGAIRVGLAPAPVNTLLQARDYAYILADSGARAVLVSATLRERMAESAALAGWTGAVVVSGTRTHDDGLALAALMAGAPPAAAPALGAADRAAFWLYSSGSTGPPKGVVHRHASLLASAERFGREIVGLRADDVVFSAAKLFFAYGLGNSLTFPISVGATCVLHPGRATPEAVWRLLAEHRITVFCGVPTLFASMLASPEAPLGPLPALRLCLSAGEPLPAEVGRAWTARFGVEIVDGIGSTEMLHIFVTNRPGEVRPGVTGRPTPGYEVRLVDEGGQTVAPGDIGELYVRGPTAGSEYWGKPEKTAATFVDGWVKTGDKFRQDDHGDLVYCGRADDMLKVSGIWVSPAEVEAALAEHEAVLEAAVIGAVDRHGLVKAKAFVVLGVGAQASDRLADDLRAFVKLRLAAYKRPHLIAFVDDLPKTATGKIRRHVLREGEAR